MVAKSTESRKHGRYAMTRTRITKTDARRIDAAIVGLIQANQTAPITDPQWRKAYAAIVALRVDLVPAGLKRRRRGR